MARYYHIYECKPCDKRWGTEKGDGTRPRTCDRCQQYCRVIESREMVHNYYKCGGCDSEWTCQKPRPTRCKKCGTRVTCTKVDPKMNSGPKRFIHDASINESTAKHLQRMMEERNRSQQQEHHKFSSHQNLTGLGTDSFREESQHISRHNEDIGRPQSESRQQSMNSDELRQADANKLFDIANRHFVNEEYEVAVEKYTEAIGLSPQQTEDLYKNRSRAFMRLKKFEEAKHDLLKSVQTPVIDSGVDVQLDASLDNVTVQQTSIPSRSTALNVRIMQALYDNVFEPVHLGAVLGSNADNETLRTIIANEMPSALDHDTMIKFHPPTGFCGISKLEELCQSDGYNIFTRHHKCSLWHVCRKWILGSCEFGVKCRRNHNFFNQLNSSLIEKNNLYGVKPEIIRYLFLSQHRPQGLRRSLCYDYKNSRRHDDTHCNFLHLCVNYQNSCRCSLSHDVFNEHNQKILNHLNVSMDGHCPPEEIARRVGLWDPRIIPPYKTLNAPKAVSATATSRIQKNVTVATSQVRQSDRPVARMQKVLPVKPLMAESAAFGDSSTPRKTHLEKRMALARDEVKLDHTRNVQNQVPLITGTGIEPGADESTPHGYVGIIQQDKTVEACTWRPLWQYNSGERGWKGFSVETQVELEAAICDVETEVQYVFIEGEAVVVNMDVMSENGECAASESVNIRRMLARDKWRWYYGNKSDNKWAEITGEGGTDVQGQIERAFKIYKTTDSEPMVRVRTSNGLVLVDFQKRIGTARQAGLFLDLRRRPDPT